MKYQEIVQDLFEVDMTYALAHCISRDCKMGADIALTFRNRYPKMAEHIGWKKLKIGDAALYKGEDRRIIYNLITKDKYWNKPTDATFEKSIVSLKEEMKVGNVQKLAIPLLGARLDRLDWNKNSETIKKVFQDTDVEILVCRPE